MNSSSMSSTSNLTIDQIISGNAYCFTSRDNIGLCCNNATDIDESYYCILNGPRAVTKCMDAYNAKVGGTAGLACTANLEDFPPPGKIQPDNNGSRFDSKVSKKLILIWCCLMLSTLTLNSAL